MTFTEKDQLIALSIVSIFETSKPIGDYAACVVLNDGAGVSYGICQFTHRSGSLAEVVERYLAAGGRVGATTLTLAMPWLQKRTPYAIKRLAASEQLKKALVAAAVTHEMKDAQHEVAFEKYLKPAIEFCEARGFTEPLSLAVVYDSIVHGSLDRIAQEVRVTPLGVKSVRASKDATLTEEAWITAYVRRRHIWLSNIARLKATTYRTKFFLDQIAIGNWELTLPLNVHGVRLSAFNVASAVAIPSSISTQPSADRSPTLPHSDAGSTTTVLDAAANTFDRVDNTITTVTTRTDRAKSLWTTVAGTTWQTAWAIFGWITGLPREVWIVVAVIVAMLVLLYLYRQIALGKLREAAARQEDG